MRWVPSICLLLCQAFAGPRREAAPAAEDHADISKFEKALLVLNKQTLGSCADADIL